MKISVDEVPQSPKEIRFSESLEELKEVYRRSKTPDFVFPSSLEVELVHYRSGAELFFTGSFRGRFTGACCRCLEPYDFPLESRFDFVLAPEAARTHGGPDELSRDDLGLSYYSTDEINLTPLIAEQVMLALPTRPLCSEDCRGLCGTCGVNLNRESCWCAEPVGDPRMAIFRNLKVGR